MSTRVFLSATFIDLEEHRRLIREAIKRLEHDAKSMELFGALPESPKEECLRLVRACEIYVGVFGMRYGALDLDTGKSFTQLEYEEAATLNLPCLIYLIDEDRHVVLPRHVEVGEQAAKLALLKANLRKKHVVGFFTSPQDLATKVTLDIVQLLGARERVHTADVLAQIAKNVVARHPLTEPRFRFFKARLDGVFKHSLPDAILRESLELILAGDNLAASFVLSRGARIPLDDAVDGLMEIEKIISEVIHAGRNKLEEKENQQKMPSSGTIET